MSKEPSVKISAKSENLTELVVFRAHAMYDRTSKHTVILKLLRFYDWLRSKNRRA